MEISTLEEKYRMLLSGTPTDFVRGIHDEIAWDDRLIAITGARGVGKTTLVLQHIKLHEKEKESLFVNADDIWFSTHRLIDLADAFFKDGGKNLYIDEIHKYRNWSQEIKNIYDYYPRLKVCYTGSSILDIQKGGYDLSRRLLEYRMYGLSFREYLALSRNIVVPVHSLEKILSGDIDFPYDEIRPLAEFKEYLKNGYYPYFKENGYFIRLNNVINTVIEDDIPKFASLSATLSSKLKMLLYIIAQSVPFKPNYSKLAEEMNIHRNYISDLTIWLEKSGMINILRDDTHGVRLLGKVNKIYLNNTNLAYVLSDTEPNIGNIRETAFLSMAQPKMTVTASPVADFKSGKYTFEVGGKSKRGRQIGDTEDSFLVKDDIEYAFKNSIPLWAFGLLY